MYCQLCQQNIIDSDTYCVLTHYRWQFVLRILRYVFWATLWKCWMCQQQLFAFLVVQGVLYQENTSCNPPHGLGGGSFDSPRSNGLTPNAVADPGFLRRELKLGVLKPKPPAGRSGITAAHKLKCLLFYRCLSKRLGDKEVQLCMLNQI